MDWEALLIPLQQLFGYRHLHLCNSISMNDLQATSGGKTHTPPSSQNWLNKGTTPSRRVNDALLLLGQMFFSKATTRRPARLYAFKGIIHQQLHPGNPKSPHEMSIP
jgi:hypothetical protein